MSGEKCCLHPADQCKRHGRNYIYCAVCRHVMTFRDFYRQLTLF